MKTLTKLAILAAAAICSSDTVQAITIYAPDASLTPALVDPTTKAYVAANGTTVPYAFWYGTDNSNLDATALAGIIGVSAASMTQIYKVDVDGLAESGSYAGAYQSKFNPTKDALDGSITLSNGQTGFTSTTGSLWLYVKDGDNFPSYYLFNITGWAGDKIYLEDFWPTQGAISNVAIYASTQGTTNTSVPDGGATAVLLGFGLVAVGFAARRFSMIPAKI